MIHKVGDLIRFRIMRTMLNGFYELEQIGLITEVKMHARTAVCYLVLSEDKEHWIQNRDILEVL